MLFINYQVLLVALLSRYNSTLELFMINKNYNLCVKTQKTLKGTS